MWCYKISGLEVASEVELGNGLLPSAQAGAPDIRVLRADVPADFDDAAARGPNWAMRDGQFLLRAPHARFLMTKGHEIAFATEDGQDENDSIVFLLGSAFGILLHQRGDLVLHASSVAVNGKAVLFCGPSGAGKSTLAAALARRGYPFVNDDLCHIGFDNSDQPVVFPDGRMLKLWADALADLALDESKGEAVRKSIEKYYVAPPGEPAAKELPLSAIYILREQRAPMTAGIEELNVVDRSLALRRNAYRPLLITKMGLRKAFFLDSIKLQRHAKIFHLTRPLGFPLMPEVIGWLEDHWRKLQH
jgi:hypothetical protein